MKLRAMIIAAIASASLAAPASAAKLFVTVSGTVTTGEDNISDTLGDPISSTDYHLGDKFSVTLAFDTNNASLAAPADEILTSTGSSLDAQIASGKSPSAPRGSYSF